MWVILMNDKDMLRSEFWNRSYEKDVISHDQLRCSKNNLLIFLRVVIMMWTYILLLPQQLTFKWTPELSQTNVLFMTYWAIWFVLCVGLIHSIKHKSTTYIPLLFGLTWVRITLPLLDLENKAKDSEPYENALTLIFLGRSQNMFQIIFNFALLGDDPILFKYSILTTFVTAST